MNRKEVLWFDNIKIHLFDTDAILIDTYIDVSSLGLDPYHESLYFTHDLNSRGESSWVGVPIYEKIEVINI